MARCLCFGSKRYRPQIAGDSPGKSSAPPPAPAPARSSLKKRAIEDMDAPPSTDGVANSAHRAGSNFRANPLSPKAPDRGYVSSQSIRSRVRINAQDEVVELPVHFVGAAGKVSLRESALLVANNAVTKLRLNRKSRPASAFFHVGVDDRREGRKQRSLADGSLERLAAGAAVSARSRRALGPLERQQLIAQRLFDSEPVEVGRPLSPQQPGASSQGVSGSLKFDALNSGAESADFVLLRHSASRRCTKGADQPSPMAEQRVPVFRLSSAGSDAVSAQNTSDGRTAGQRVSDMLGALVRKRNIQVRDASGRLSSVNSAAQHSAGQSNGRSTSSFNPSARRRVSLLRRIQMEGGASGSLMPASSQGFSACGAAVEATNWRPTRALLKEKAPGSRKRSMSDLKAKEHSREISELRSRRQSASSNAVPQSDVILTRLRSEPLLRARFAAEMQQMDQPALREACAGYEQEFVHVLLQALEVARYEQQSKEPVENDFELPGEALGRVAAVLGVETSEIQRVQFSSAPTDEGSRSLVVPRSSCGRPSGALSKSSTEA